MKQQTIAYNWSLAHAIAMLFLTSFALLMQNMFVFAMGTALSFSIFIFSNLNIFRTTKPFGGYANWITIFRMVLLFYVAISFQNLDHIYIVSIFLLNIILDILDGFVARKFKTASIFGAYFDMELDAFYVCLAALILHTENLVGGWIIWIGLLRYLYTFIIILLNINIISEPKQKFATIIAGFLFWSLLLPFYNTKFNYVLILATCLVVISFVKSFLFQIKRS